MRVKGFCGVVSCWRSGGGFFKKLPFLLRDLGLGPLGMGKVVRKGLMGL